MVQIREATTTDSEVVAKLIHHTWPQQQPSAVRIEKVQERVDHTLLIAEQDGRVVGFVSGFVTRAQDGTLRWELDLLAVDSGARGKGIGKTLIRACSQVARQHDTSVIRTLIRADNAPMMAACRACNYQQEPVERQLMIGMPNVEANGFSASSGIHLVEVHTLTYSGLWIEGEFEDGCFQHARQVLSERGLDAVGALVSMEEQQVIQMAASVDYTPVASYYIWTYAL